MLRGEVLQRLKRWSESRESYEAALKIDRASPAPFLGMACISLAENDYEQAAAHARASLELLFFQPRSHYILGLAQYRLGSWQEAEQAFITCVGQAPLFSPGYRMLGEISRFYKRDPVATVFYQKQVKDSRARMAQLRAERSGDVQPLPPDHP